MPRPRQRLCLTCQTPITSGHFCENCNPDDDPLSWADSERDSILPIRLKLMRLHGNNFIQACNDLIADAERRFTQLETYATILANTKEKAERKAQTQPRRRGPARKDDFLPTLPEQKQRRRRK